MKILDIHALRGPNIYHNKPCIIMRLDLEEMEQRPSDTIPNFRERIEKIIPSLIEHRCSVGQRGGFLQRVEEGTWMGHIMEHVALELQTLASMDAGFGRTRETATPGVYNVVYRYIEENCGIYAGEKAFELIELLADSRESEFNIDEVIQHLKELRERYQLGPSTKSLVDEAIRRGIPWIRLNNRSLVQLGHGSQQRRIQATTTNQTSMIGVEIACDKDSTKQLLGDSGVPVPVGEEVQSLRGALSVAHDVGYPVVVKPSNGNHGKGATIGIVDDESLERAFDVAKEYSRYVIVEKKLEGYDFRALVINHQFVSAAQRVPAHVMGDGKNTIEQLVDLVNQDPRRGFGHEKVLTELAIDAMTERLLLHQGLALDSVPDKGQMIVLKSTANLSTGGTAVDVTDRVHPNNVAIFERISRIIDLDICGIDIIADNLEEPLDRIDGGVIEVNAAPGFRMHLAPSDGIGRNVAEPVIDMLFPDGNDGRIPIIALTGTNGKTTTTRLMSHVMHCRGYHVGYTTSDGVYIDNQCVMSGDMTGPFSAQAVLKDPMVEFAVLECARGGLIRRGLGFSSCDIGIVLNIAEDHLGMNDIHSLDDLARVKRVIVDVVRPSGWAILNADDPYVAAMADYSKGRVTYFSMDPENEIIREQSQNGEVSCIYENGYITILNGQWMIRVIKATEVPLTMDGRAPFMIQNVLAVTLAAFLRKIKPADIGNALRTFVPGFATTPGRLNRMQINDIEILVDFAHNPAGYRALGSLIERISAKRKIATISAVGDRRDVDIQDIGKLAAGMFTDIVIRESKKYRRGREPGSIAALLKKSIIESGFDAAHVQVEEDERDAVHKVLSMADPGDLVTIIADDISMCQDEVEKFREQVEPNRATREDIPNLVRNAAATPSPEPVPEVAK